MMKQLSGFRHTNWAEQRERWDRDIDNEYRNLLRRFKKNEKVLAPLMFPFMETKRRHKDGIHMSEVSTPTSTQFAQAVMSTG